MRFYFKKRYSARIKYWIVTYSLTVWKDKYPKQINNQFGKINLEAVLHQMLCQREKKIIIFELVYTYRNLSKLIFCKSSPFLSLSLSLSVIDYTLIKRELWRNSFIFIISLQILISSLGHRDEKIPHILQEEWNKSKHFQSFASYTADCILIMLWFNLPRVIYPQIYISTFIVFQIILQIFYLSILPSYSKVLHYYLCHFSSKTFGIYIALGYVFPFVISGFW